MSARRLIRALWRSEVGAGSAGSEIAIVEQAKAVIGAHRRRAGTQAR
jgi:hypothetical protein